MAQAGIHSMVGIAVRKWTPKQEWLVPTKGGFLCRIHTSRGRDTDLCALWLPGCSY
jgi:hypothetical protein